MSVESPPSETLHRLSYQSHHEPIRIRIRIAQWMRRRPIWLVSLTMVIPALVLSFSLPSAWLRHNLGSAYSIDVEKYLPFAALFLPAAIQRTSWRQLLAMVAVAGVAFEIKPWFFDDELQSVYQLLPISGLVVGIADWLINPPRRWPDLLWMLMLTTAVAFIVAVVGVPLERTISLPIADLRVSPGYMAHWLLLPVLTWLAIPAAQRLANDDRRWQRWTAVTSSTACVALFFAFFRIVVFITAANSLKTGWPLEPEYAMWFLEHRGSPEDQKKLWKVVESTDWLQPLPPLQSRWCINSLAKIDRAAAAGRLSSMLRNKPSPALAECAAPILADEKRYETAPELMRYALQNSSITSDSAIHALESMRIPQAADAILFQSRIFSIAWEHEPEPASADWIIREPEEQRLAKLLGHDQGRSGAAWTAFYRRNRRQFPTPLSAEQVEKLDRTIEAMNQYWIVVAYLSKSGNLAKIPPPNLNIPGTLALEQEIDRYRGADALYGK